jgi:hypothetical protein
MKRLPLLTAAAGLATVFGVANAKADCPDGQDCVPDDANGGMKCLSGYGGGIAACEEKFGAYDGSGHPIPMSKYCYYTICGDPPGHWYYYTYYQWYYYNYICDFCGE